MSIAWKLIIASSAMAAVTVLIITWVSVGRISEQASYQIKRHEEIGKQSFQRESVLVGKTLAQSLSFLLAVNAWNEITPTLEAAILEHLRAEGETLSEAHHSARPVIEWLVAFEGEEPETTKTLWTTSKAPNTQRALNDTRLQLGPRPAGKPEARCPDLAPGRLQEAWLCESPIVYGGKMLGTLRMRVSAQGLINEVDGIKRSYAQREAAYRRNVWLVAGAILLFGVLLAAVQGIRLAKPIKQLTERAASLGGGDLGSRVPTGRRDELGVLAESFNVMADRIGVLLVEQAKKATLEHEMSLARSVQQSMLPPQSIQRLGHLRVVGYCAPASSCGGDWWMWRKLSGDRMLVVVGDATGHGIHSAMIAATARGAVEALAALDEKLLAPEQVLRAIDSAIRNVGEHHVLMTAFAALFDSGSGVLSYANAGQNFPYIVRRSAGRVLDDAAILASSGNPLGDREIPLEIRGGSRQLGAGDVFVCFTDGLVERASPAGALFGDRRLLRAMRSQPVDSEAALVALRAHVVKVVEDHAAGGEASDDVTFVMCQYDPPVAVLQKSAGTG